jgi:hypothetical protein
MRWEEVREQYPNRFVLVEAIKASSKDRIRTIEKMAVIKGYEDSKAAWNGYKEHHREDSKRELYIFHTSKDKIEVMEGYFTGTRGRA